jgi:hypothetical protein
VQRWQGHAGPRSHLQARRRRPRQVRPGVYGFRSLSPAPAQFAAEAGLTAYALMACGRGRGRHLQRHHRREMETLWSRWSPGPPLSASRRSRDRRLRARRSGRSGRTAPCRPTVPSPMARRVSARHRSSRLGAVLRNWETATEARASRHRQKSARARRTDSMRKVSGLGAIPPSRQFSRGQTVSDCSPRLLSP